MAYIGDDPDEWPPSVLSPKQRERLAEDGLDPTVPADRVMLSRIRKRIQAAVFDLGALSRTLDQSEIEKAFEDPDDQVYQPIGSTVPDVLALFYLADWEQETAPTAPSEGWSFATRVEGAVERALNTRGIGVENVSVDIDIERAESLDVLASRDLNELPRQLLSQLLFSGAISHEEFAEATMSPAEGSQEQDETDDE